MYKRKINYLVVHCTATSQETSILQIKNYWRNVLKWRNNGYHFVIDKYGKIHNITPIDLVANGVKNFNKNSIHISYVGGIDKNGKSIDNRNFEQKQSLRYLLHDLQMKFPDAKILGHRDFPNVRKDCPCFDAKMEYKNILDVFG